ncbi:MAG: hypothetical protein AB1762_03930 [Gemmatimonadota bacterium]
MSMANTQSIKLAHFVKRLAAFDAGSWDRVAARVPTLGGDHFEALVVRGKHWATGLTAVSPFLPRAVTTILGVIHELQVEFRAPMSDAQRSALDQRIAAPSADSDSRTLAQAWLALDSLLLLYRTAYPGVATAAEAVAFALTASSRISPAQLARLYAPFESEIPYASLGATLDVDAA